MKPPNSTAGFWKMSCLYKGSYPSSSSSCTQKYTCLPKVHEFNTDFGVVWARDWALRQRQGQQAPVLGVLCLAGREAHWLLAKTVMKCYKP
jgi:hypothetical protein